MARVAMGEIGRELGRVGQFLTGSYEYVGTVVGSPLDRLLSRAIGQPLTFYLIVKHGKPGASRLDIVSDFSTVQPTEELPKQGRIGFKAGSVYSKDQGFARRILYDAGLVSRIAEIRSQYIQVDNQAVTFVFAGSENDWSAMIREQEGYPELINHIQGILADIADRI